MYIMESSRLIFSTWNTHDFPLAQSLWQDPAVARYISSSGIFTDEQIHDRLQIEIKNQKLYHIQYWPLFSKSDNDFIGCCGLRPYDTHKKIYEIGFHLMQRHWGKGYGSEAATTVIHYAYEVLKATSLFAGHHPENTASATLLKKLNFTYSHDEYYPPTALNHPSYIHTHSKNNQKETIHYGD